MAVATARRRTDGDKDRIGIGDRFGDAGRELQTPGFDISGDQTIEVRFENRNLAAQQRFDLARVLVDTGDDMTEVGEACARHKAHITSADHCNVHGASFFNNDRLNPVFRPAPQP